MYKSYLWSYLFMHMTVRSYWKCSCKDYGTNPFHHPIHSSQIMGRETRIVTVALISFQSIGRISSMGEEWYHFQQELMGE